MDRRRLRYRSSAARTPTLHWPKTARCLIRLRLCCFRSTGANSSREHRFVVDAEGFRQTRKKELQAMARFAGDQVRKNGVPFTFGVLNSTERRVIHTAASGRRRPDERIYRRRPRPKASGPPQIKDFLNRMIRMLRIEAIFHPAGSVHPVNSLWRIR